MGGDLIATQKSRVAEKSYQGKISFDTYYSHDDLNAYIDDLAAQNDFISTVSIGKSHEGRDMRVIKIAKAGAGAPNVWIEAGIHAREWIAPAMATYIIDSLLNNDVDGFTDKMNIHVLPSANPDGYEYSRSSDRLWRKTRSNYNSIFLCKGVDGNRNWDFHWAETVEEIRGLAEDAVKALEAVHGTVFEPINSADLYPAAGASDDWYKGVLKARFAYTFELRDTGRHGFVLPEDQIKPSGEELWEAQRVIFQKMVDVSNEV